MNGFYQASANRICVVAILPLLITLKMSIT